MLAKHADEAGAWLQGVKVFRYSDETAEAVANSEILNDILRDYLGFDGMVVSRHLFRDLHLEVNRNMADVPGFKKAVAEIDGGAAILLDMPYLHQTGSAKAVHR